MESRGANIVQRCAYTKPGEPRLESGKESWRTCIKVCNVKNISQGLSRETQKCIAVHLQGRHVK